MILPCPLWPICMKSMKLFTPSSRTQSRISLEESERQFLKEIRPAGFSFQPPAQTEKGHGRGKGPGYQRRRCPAPILAPGRALPGRSRAATQGRKRPANAVGRSFFCCEPGGEPDRRSGRLKLTEKAAELERIQNTKLFVAEGKEVAAEVPLFREHTQTRIVEIPDGGTFLMPVLYRPRVARDKGRWWALSITPRIVIEAEEKAIENAIKGSVPKP